MRLGYLELITLLNFCCGEQSLRTVKEKCPHFWSSVSTTGHITSFFGLSTTNWWKERYLFQHVIPELALYLNLILNRSFTFRDERQLELIWQSVSANCTLNQSFFNQVTSVFPQIEELVKAPFPKFALVRRAYEKSNLKRGFQVLGWNETETLSEYETRISKGTSKREREDSFQAQTVEPDTHVLRSIIKSFRSIQAKSAQIEKELGRLSFSVKQMVSDAVTIRFEAAQVFEDVERLSTRFQQIVVLSGTLHLDLQEIELGQRLNVVENGRLIITSLDERLSDIMSLFDEWKRERESLQNTLKRLFEALKSRIAQLRVEVDAYSQSEHPSLYNEMFSTHIQDSMNMIKEYERSLLKPPGPVLLIQNIEIIVRENLKFLEKIQNYSRETQKQVNK